MLKNGFRTLNIVQFLDALNENLFKLLTVFFLIHLNGIAHTATISTVIGGLFLLPFIVFSSLGGIFGDGWSKTTVIRITRIIQVGVTFLAVICAALQWESTAYILLVLMSTLAALFGPSKYGIIAELITPKDTMRANSYIAACTLFGIILGTFFAALLNTVFPSSFPLTFAVCFLLSLVEAYLSFRIPKTKAANPDKKPPLFIYRELYQTFVEMRKTPFLILSTFACSYFLFLGAFVQINIIPFGVETLHGNPNIGGFLFAFSVVGMGIGSLIASRLKLNLRLIPPCLGMGSIGCWLLAFVPEPIWINGLWLIVLGITAGIFLVPAQAFLVAHSAPEDRARNFGAMNFWSSIFALLAAVCLYILQTIFHFDAAQNFNVLAWMNLAVAGLLYGSLASNTR